MMPKRFVASLLASAAALFLVQPGPRSSVLHGILGESRLPPRTTDLDPYQRRLLESLMHLGTIASRQNLSAADTPTVRPDAIFAPGTPANVVEAFYERFPDHGRYQGSSRWTSTANQVGPLFQGDPTVITWGFARDGSQIQGTALGSENASATSNARAFFNAIYGSQAATDAVFQQVFDRWQALTGVVIVKEPNDDGAPMGSRGATGLLGVRADVRIGGRYLDGPSNVLAYNYFPNNGDMVFDTADSFYNLTGANVTSLGTRNVIAHEHGHGLGMSHVCPVTQSKLMEPYVSFGFDGPQFDDILGGQRRYGDPDEQGGGNDSAGTATALGNLGNGTTTRDQRSIDDGFATDQDYYSFAVPAGKTATVTMTPLGSTYLEGPQVSGGCSPGSNYSPQSFINLDVALLGTDGTTQLALANTQPAGSAETTGAVNFPTAGTYFVHVFKNPAASVADAQMYRLDIAIADGGPAPATHSVTVNGAGSGIGTVQVEGAGAGGSITCTVTAGLASGDCVEAGITEGTSFGLVATASAGSVFSGWASCTSTSGNICTVTLSADTTVTVTFDTTSTPPPPGSPAPTVPDQGVQSTNAMPLNLDGSGRSATIAYNATTGGATVFSENGVLAANTVLSAATNHGWSPGWTIKPGDFNGDGRTDLLFYNVNTGLAYKAISDGTFGFSYTALAYSPGWSIGILNLNGDAMDDAFFYNPGTGQWYRGTSVGSGTGEFVFAGGSWSPSWLVIPMRLDLDALDDLLLYNKTSGAYYRVLNTGTGFTIPPGGSWSPGWELTPGNFNADTLEDLFFYNSTSGWYYVGLNDGTTFAFTGGSFSPGWTVRAGDFSGDGLTDLFLYSFSTGWYYVCVANGAGGFAYSGGTLSSGWQTFVTSFNLDALADVLFYNATSGSYFQGITTTPGSFNFFGGNFGAGQTIVTNEP